LKNKALDKVACSRRLPVPSPVGVRGAILMPCSAETVFLQAQREVSGGISFVLIIVAAPDDRLAFKSKPSVLFWTINCVEK